METIVTNNSQEQKMNWYVC